MTTRLGFKVWETLNNIAMLISESEIVEKDKDCILDLLASIDSQFDTIVQGTRAEVWNTIEKALSDGACLEYSPSTKTWGVLYRAPDDYVCEEKTVKEAIYTKGKFDERRRATPSID
jgi:hypothetical protein